MGNQNGININILTLTNEKLRDVLTLHQTLTNSEQNYNNLYIRANLPIKDYVSHIPTIIKSFVLTLRQADPSILLLPFDYRNRKKLHYPMKSKKLKNGYLECVSITTESGRTGGLISHISSSGDDQYRFVDFF